VHASYLAEFQLSEWNENVFKDPFWENFQFIHANGFQKFLFLSNVGQFHSTKSENFWPISKKNLCQLAAT